MYNDFLFLNAIYGLEIWVYFLKGVKNILPFSINYIKLIRIV